MKVVIYILSVTQFFPTPFELYHNIFKWFTPEMLIYTKVPIFPESELLELKSSNEISGPI